MDAGWCPMHPISGLRSATRFFLPLQCRRYLDGKNQMLYPEPRDVFPCDLIHSGQSHPAMELPIVKQ